MSIKTVIYCHRRSLKYIGMEQKRPFSTLIFTVLAIDYKSLIITQLSVPDIYPSCPMYYCSNHTTISRPFTYLIQLIVFNLFYFVVYTIKNLFAQFPKLCATVVVANHENKRISAISATKIAATQE